MDPYVIPPLNIPVIPVFPAEPPTRGMAPPPTRGMTPPTAIIPEADAPTINLPPPTVTNPDPGRPRPGAQEDLGQEQQQEQTPEDTRDLPMAPFDASTEISVTVPVIDREVTIPVPKPEVVITAGTTAMTAAVGATGAAIMSKPLFEWLQKKLKPLAKKIAKKLLKKKEKTYPKSVHLEHTLPDQFLFEGSRLSPLLLRQHRDRRKEKKGARKPPSESTQCTSEP